MASTIVYVKKITSSMGWLRRLDAVDPANDQMIKVDPQPIMRVKARLIEGWEETSDLGVYARWIGQINARVVNRDGTLSDFVSRNLIMPQVVSDFLMQGFTQETKETTVKNRTGQHFALPDEFSYFDIVFDLYIRQPSGKRVSATGYEFHVEIVKAPEVKNPIAELDSDVAAFGTKAIEAAKEKETSTGEINPQPEQTSENQVKDPVTAEHHGTGKRGKAA